MLYIWLVKAYLEMEDVCSGLSFMVLAWEQGCHLQVRAIRKNLQMSSELKYNINLRLLISQGEWCFVSMFQLLTLSHLLSSCSMWCLRNCLVYIKHIANLFDSYQLLNMQLFEIYKMVKTVCPKRFKKMLLNSKDTFVSYITPLKFRIV